MKYEPGKFYQLPRDMARILKNPFEFVVLSRLLDRADENTGDSFPSFRDLTQGIMCRNKAIESIKALQNLGIISIEHTPYKQNTYRINYEVLIQLIKNSAPHELDHNMNTPSAPPEPPGAPHELGVVHDMDTNDNHRNDNPKRKPVTKTRHSNDKRSYGQFHNVFLTDNEVTSLKKYFTDYLERIEHFSEKIKGNGYENRYKDHYATILSWARSDAEKTAAKHASYHQMPAPRPNPDMARQEAQRIVDQIEIDEKVVK